MVAGLKKAIQVPLTMMRIARQCWPHFETMAEHGNIATVSDLQVRVRKLYNYTFCTQRIIHVHSCLDHCYIDSLTKGDGPTLGAVH